ncbi:Uncharacterised protein [Mycobacteroides abscessus subsp. abscessus]|nr:Uncharacterised protein [Mycobacteroides abscessus subsp. abscessus]
MSSTVHSGPAFKQPLELIEELLLIIEPNFSKQETER